LEKLGGKELLDDVNARYERKEKCWTRLISDAAIRLAMEDKADFAKLKATVEEIEIVRYYVVFCVRHASVHAFLLTVL